MFGGQQMLALQIKQHGGPEVLRNVKVPVPTPGPGQVLVRNAWIGVNFVDLQHRAGWPYPVELPLIPGTEASGVVHAVGREVDPGLVGSSVAHFGHLMGVYAEFTAVPMVYVAPVPADVGLDLAAAVALSGSTAHVLVREATSVNGKIVVVHAAAGATGGAVVQLAVAEGARVIGITSTRAKADAAIALGAFAAIAADTEDDLASAVLTITDGMGADIVFDASGRSTFDASLQMLAARGTLVLYGAASGHPEPFAVEQLSGLTGEAGRRGSLSVKWVAAADYLAGGQRQQVLSRVLADVAAGRLLPRIEGRIPLRRAVNAHLRLAARNVTGKLLLQP